MRDGSDAVSDWPLLNALLNTASRRHLGVAPPRRRRRHGLLAACRHGHRLRRHAGRGAAHRARAVERPGDRRDAPRRCGLRASRSTARASMGWTCRCCGCASGAMISALPTARPAGLLAAPAARAWRRAPLLHRAGRRWRDARAEASASRARAARMARGRRAPSTASTPASASWPAPASRTTQLAQLQLNLVLSHAAGTGAAAADAGRAAGAGAQGGEPGARLFRRAPAVDRRAAGAATTPASSAGDPGQGSVGASGDLAPLAHMTLALIGVGEVARRRRRAAGAATRWRAAGHRAARARRRRRASRCINGTQVSTALALAGAVRRRGRASSGAGRRRADASMPHAAATRPSTPRIHALRGQPGQIDVARRAARACSPAARSALSHLRRRRPRAGPLFACAASRRSMGACLDLLRHAAAVLLREANAVTDNPLVFADDGRDRSPAAISTPSRSPSPPTRWPWPSPRSAPSPSAASPC